MCCRRCRHVIQHQNAVIPLLENLLYLLDVYNDSAHRALYALKQRHLYDEIEVSLVFGEEGS